MAAELSPTSSRPTKSHNASLLSALVALPASAALAFLLWHLFYRGTPWSHDPMTYARSLWGIAHGDFYNPVVFAPVFAIHFQLDQFLLAPFAHIAPPIIVLAIAQALAFGSLIWLAARSFGLAAAESGGSVALAILYGAFLTLASPLILNPFLFDARPEMVGVPLVAAGLLRAERRGELDRKSVVLLLASLAAREDFAIIVAPALVLIPLRNGVSMRWRVVAAAGATLYLAAYLFGVRWALGGADFVRGSNALVANMIDPAAEKARPYSLPELLQYKSEILLIAGTAVGAFALRSRRWLLLSLPGLAFLFAQNRLQPWILNTHYAIFLAPALLVAGVAGYRRWTQQGRPHRYAVIAASIVSAAGAYLLSGGAPGGGRYAQVRFAWSVSKPFSTSGLSPVVASMRAMLEQVPAAEGLMVPYVFGPPLAARPVIHYVEGTSQAMIAEGGVPPGVDWVALFPNQWSGYGRALVERQGFVLHDLVPRSMALLSRKRSGLISATTLLAAMPRMRCDEPLGEWPAAGLQLCSVGMTPGPRPSALVRRVSAAQLPGPSPVLTLVFRDSHGRAALVPLQLFEGMLPFGHLPIGAEGVAIATTKVPLVRSELALIDARSGKAFAARTRGSASVEAIAVEWSRPPG